MRRVLGWLLVSLLAVAPATRGEETPQDALKAMIAELEEASPGMGDAAAEEIRRRATRHLARLANQTEPIDGVPPPLVGNHLVQRVANVLAHRHERHEEARELVGTARSVFASMGDERAKLMAKILADQEKATAKLSGRETHEVARETFGEVEPWVLAVAGAGGLLALAVGAYFAFWRKDRAPEGMTLVDAGAQARAQQALERGIELLQEGREMEAVAYFQKVAQLQSTLKAKGQFCLALVSLRRGDTDTAVTQVSRLDMKELDPDEVYALGDHLERSSQLEHAHKVFQQLFLRDTSYKDVERRTEDLRAQLAEMSETHVGQMIAERILDSRFRQVEMIGYGGMGVVFKGLDSKLGDIPVALKVLSPYLANKGNVRERFIREADCIKGIEHPNVIRVHDVFEKNLPYYSMEFLTWGDLGDLLKANPGGLPPARIARIMDGVCAGLGAAHALGIVHRDMKPDNILVNEALDVKVIDFGIAKLLTESSMTMTGQVLGTPRYMAPEQVKGMEIDRRADVYALGVMLYQMLVGRAPFDQAMEHVFKPVPIPPPEQGVHGPLLEVALRCMEKNAADRYPGLAEMREALRAAAAAG